MRLKLTFLLISCLFLFSFKKDKPSSKDYLVTISTRFGEMKIVLFDDTPKHKENFLKLAQEGFYDSTTFHRVIKKFMIQGGDPNSKDDNPNNDGLGGPGYTIDAEIKHKHKFGSLAAARLGDRANPKRASSGSQFYIVQNHDGTPHLDGTYTVFGQVISGFEVIDKIAVQATGFSDRPYENIYMTVTVELVKKKKITKKYDYIFPE